MSDRRTNCPKCEREIYVQPFCPFCGAIVVAMWIPEGSATPIPFRALPGAETKEGEA